MQMRELVILPEERRTSKPPHKLDVFSFPCYPFCQSIKFNNHTLFCSRIGNDALISPDTLDKMQELALNHLSLVTKDLGHFQNDPVKVALNHNRLVEAMNHIFKGGIS